MTTSACLLSKEQIRQWIVDLRSGEFQQTREVLQDSDGYCCLGVLAQRLGTLEDTREIDDNEHAVAGRNVLGCENKLMTMNDTYKNSFREIADFIEQEILPDAPEQMAEGALLPFYDVDGSEDYHE